MLHGEAPRADLHAQAVPLIEGEPLSQCAWNPALLKPCCLSTLYNLLHCQAQLKQPKRCRQRICNALNAQAIPLCCSDHGGSFCRLHCVWTDWLWQDISGGQGSQLCHLLSFLLYLILQPDWEWLQATPQCSYLSQELTGQPMQCCTAACHAGCMLLAPRAPKLSLHWFAAMRQQT